MKRKTDLFDTSLKVVDIYSKDQQRWTADDYVQAMESLSDTKMDFNVSFERRLLMSVAFRNLSPRSSKLLMLCQNNAWMKPVGDRRKINKHSTSEKDKQIYEAQPFYCPYNLCVAFGIGSKKQISEAFKELKAFGFIDLIGVARRNYRSVYELSDKWESKTAEDIKQIRADLKQKKQTKDSNRNLETVFKVAI